MIIDCVTKISVIMQIYRDWEHLKFGLGFDHDSRDIELEGFKWSLFKLLL